MAFQAEFFDSFDQYGATGTSTNLLQWWDAGAFSTLDFGTTNARTGIALHMTTGFSNHAYVEKALASNRARIQGHFSFNLQFVDGSLRSIFELWDGATQQGFILASANVLSYQTGASGSGTIVASGGVTMNNNTTYVVEFDITIDPSAGAVILKIDGVTIVNATGLNTRASANSQATKYRLGSSQAFSNMNVYFDDFFIHAATSNTLTGPLKLYYQPPSGNGNYSQMTNSGGNSTNNFSYVDEQPGNGDTDYVESGTSGIKDTYAVTDLTPVSGAIKAVAAQSLTKLDNAGATQLEYLLRNGGSDFLLTIISPTTSYKYYSSWWELNPNGNIPWNIAAFNSSELGQQVV